LTDHTQDIPHPESLAALASLLDQYATGSGRITPRPRGARLSEDVRTMLADAIAAVESAASSAGPAADLLVYGNGCYAVGRHADASGVYLSILEDEPSNAEARFNLGLAYLRIITFILVIAAVVQFTEIAIRRMSPVLYQTLGVYLPLITTNCAVLGVALLNISEKHNFMQSLFYGFGSAVGFTLVMVVFAGIRERLEMNDVPAPFAGAAIGFITAGLLSMAFMGFSGMVH